MRLHQPRGIQLTQKVESGYLLTEEPVKGGMHGVVLSLRLVLDEARSVLNHLAELVAALYTQRESKVRA